jgi:hypothetical protein
MESQDAAEKWEYFVEVTFAEADEHKEFLKNLLPGVKVPKFAPQAVIPRLNSFGSAGWQLVSIEPYYFGANGDALISNSKTGERIWTNAYLCVYRRHPRS